ncbi:unnamed protein product [Sphenostylis stenocarpa]|uniref:ALOG domain-containing protein n=1 Tax=Sphenostylis stenocarpa TaxID=92480 RepID=A0AA86VQI9_9FABA|nr:unnamed protein product [Sphenostylis stenocarpa]
MHEIVKEIGGELKCTRWWKDDTSVAIAFMSWVQCHSVGSVSNSNILDACHGLPKQPSDSMVNICCDESSSCINSWLAVTLVPSCGLIHGNCNLVSSVSTLAKQGSRSSSFSTRMSSSGKDLVEGSSSPTDCQQSPGTLSRYESQKRRDWNTFGQYLKNQRPPVPLSQCNCNHVLDFLRYLDQFGKTKVHLQGCMFYGQPEPPAPCTCPLRQAWGSLDALIGRLRAAYEENGGSPETNPFASGSIRVYLKEVRDCQAKARGIPYKKKKKGTNQTKPNDESTSTIHFS